MKEKTLLKTALICSVIGVTLLFFISGNISVSEKTIDKINKENLNEYVKVKGSITSIVNSSKVTIIEITQPQSINIVLFKANNTIGLEKGDYIEVLGKIEEYNGKMEVVGSRVRVIS